MQNDTKNEPLRRRGRPRKFEEQAALEKFRAVFVRKGFDGASLDDLSAASGLNRPSIYGAFGDKERLYIHTLQLNAAASLRKLEETLQGPGPIEERLSAVYNAAIAIYCANPGCMIVNTAAAAAPTHPAIGAAARDLRAAIEAAFAQAFAACVARRELPGDPAPATRAKLANAILDSLAVRARLGEPAASLKAFAEEAIALVCKI